MQRIQQLLIGRVAERMAGASTPSLDPRPAAIVGAAFSCMQAARTSWLASSQKEPFGVFLDDAMAVFTVR